MIRFFANGRSLHLKCKLNILHFAFLHYEGNRTQHAMKMSRPSAPVDPESLQPLRQPLVATPAATSASIDGGCSESTKTSCALCGLLIAWIPVVGILTYIFSLDGTAYRMICFWIPVVGGVLTYLCNLDAKRYDARYKLSRGALIISLLSLLFNTIWPAYARIGYHHNQQQH